MTRAQKILQEASKYDFKHPAVQMSKAIMAKHPDKKVKPKGKHT